MNILKSYFGTPGSSSQSDTTADGPDPDPEDIWSFTDPDARDAYAREGKLHELEHDIRFEVMRGEPWFPEELEYKREIKRLLKAGAIEDKGTYWFTSPFPTVYRSLRNGSMKIGDQDFRFNPGEDIVFQCRMTREMGSSSGSLVLISKLEPTSDAKLCGEMGNAMRGKAGM